MPELESGCFTLIYTDPPFNTGRARTRRTVRTQADPDGDRQGFGGRRYRTEEVSTIGLSTTGSTTTRRSSSRACGRCTGCCSAEGTLYLHLDYREAHYAKLLLDELFGRGVLPQRDHLGLRLRRQAAAALAGQARHDPGVRARSRPRTCSTPTPIEREPYMAPGPGHAREGGAGQAADRRLVAHDRLADRQGEDRLPDPEAGRAGAPDGAGVDPAGRPGAWIRSPAPARSAPSAGRWAASTC